MFAPDGHDPVSAVVEETKATLAAVPFTLMVPVASGVGRFDAPPAPAASCTRKYLPGTRKQGPAVQRDVTDQVPEPVSVVS